jgi:hypothetical protein
MTSQPDKLFRDKLENFQKPAPVAAWNRIEADLEKSSNKGLWMKIAAGLVLLSVATILLWPSNNANTNLLTDKSSTQQQPEVKQELSASENSSNTTETTPSLSSKKEVKGSIKTKSVEKIKEAKEHQPELLAQITEQSKQNSEIENLVSSNQNPESRTQNLESITPEIIVAQTESKESTSKTIVYTANEVNAKFLKKQLPVEATSDEKKSSGIQKLMGLDYNLKNSDSGLGDLRQKKDEILALNFLEKKQGQN